MWHILFILPRPPHTLKGLELKIWRKFKSFATKHLSEFLDVLFRVFRFSKASLNALP